MDLLSIIYPFLIGSIIGSFLNVVIFRLPEEGASIVFPSSHCPRCKSAIGWYDNVPIISYLLLRGKCRKCNATISLQYPLVELCMALLSAGLFRKFDISFEFFFYFLFCASLLVIIFIDLHHQIIPDSISLGGIVLGFGGAFFNHGVSPLQSGLGILVGGGFFYLFALSYYLITKRDGLGGGDIKLLAMIGAFLGWQSILFVIFASSLSGSFVGLWAMVKQGKGGQTKIPFGPFLALSAMCYLFFGTAIIDFWFRLSTWNL
ncbi:MAG: prepilin peptidase [Desulfobulbaceae bacterium]|nr:prepilin peptidase [Desulfobulbaceae bacterium]